MPQNNTNSTALFSILVITFNQRHLLNNCLASIFSQNYPRIELVLCDDGSSDFDLNEVSNYIEANKPDNICNTIVYKQEKNVGTVRNCQKAVELSNGAYFKVHAGNAVFYDDKVVTDIVHEFENECVDIIASPSRASNANMLLMADGYRPSLFYQEAYTKQNNPDQMFALLASQPWDADGNAPVCFWRRSFFDFIGGYDSSYTYMADLPICLRVYKQGHTIRYIQRITTLHLCRDSSSTSLLYSPGHIIFGNPQYLENQRVLLDIGLPLLLQKKEYIHALNCRLSAKICGIRFVHERDWKLMPWHEKLRFVCKNIPFYLGLGLYNSKIVPVEGLPLCVCIILLLAVLLYFDFQLFPGWPNEQIISIALIMAVVIAFAKLLRIGWQCVNKHILGRKDA